MDVHSDVCVCVRACIHWVPSSLHLIHQPLHRHFAGHHGHHLPHARTRARRARRGGGTRVRGEWGDGSGRDSEDRVHVRLGFGLGCGAFESHVGPRRCGGEGPDGGCWAGAFSRRRSTGRATPRVTGSSRASSTDVGCWGTERRGMCGMWSGSAPRGRRARRRGAASCFWWGGSGAPGGEALFGARGRAHVAP
jgi:hypothetical protein